MTFHAPCPTFARCRGLAQDFSHVGRTRCGTASLGHPPSGSELRAVEMVESAAEPARIEWASHVRGGMACGRCGLLRITRKCTAAYAPTNSSPRLFRMMPLFALHLGLQSV
jgi:hypothetical protein